MPKKILLINPHETEQCGFTNPPLGLLYLAGTLVKHGFDVRIADGCRDGIASVYHAIKEFKPEMVGITCLTPGRKKVIELATMVKQISPETIVVLGGVHPTIMYRQMLLNYPSIDFIVLGEGEETFLELAHGNEPATIHGLAFKVLGQIVKTNPRTYSENIDEIPFPAWHLVDLKRYQARGDFVFRGIDLRTEPRVSVIFSRGCTGHCDFCSSWWIWRGYRHRSAKNMADELEILYHQYGIRHFCFADDAMTVNRDATLELCDEIITRGLHIAFHATTRSDAVDEVLLSKMHAAGCYNIAYGIETGSAQLLDQMVKENDIDTAEQAILMTKKAGILSTALIIVGNVGETVETLNETIELMQRTQPDIIGCAGGLLIFPGTKLYQHCKREGIIDDDFWLGDEPYKIYDKEWSVEALKQMEQKIYDYKQFQAIETAKQQPKQDTNPVDISFIEKWHRYVNAEVNEYSSTTLWVDAQVQHHELMSKLPSQCHDVLDLGCGDGWSTNQLRLKGKNATGVTINPNEADHARQVYGLNLVVCDMHNLPFTEYSFDCIYCRENYEHSVAPYIALCEMNRVLRNGGYTLINLPWEDWIREDSHYSVFDPSQMREMFYKCRFVVEQEGRTEHGHFWYLARKVAEIGEPHPFLPPSPGKLWLNGQTITENHELPSDVTGYVERVYNPRIVCQMRIKNEEKWLKEVLDSVARVAHCIVILDDGSMDRTPEICQTHPAVVDYRWQNEATIDEVRDKNRLLQMALAQNPDWVLCMDGDEIFEDSAPERIFNAIQKCPEDVAILDLEFLYMWDGMQYFRVDGPYNRIYHHRIFKLKDQDRANLFFQSTMHGGNFHCDSVPSNIQGNSMEIDVKIKHLGYMLHEDRLRKYLWYKSNDPQHAAQGYYEHLLDQPSMVTVEWHERPFQRLHNETSETDHLHTEPKQDLKPAYYYANARKNIADLVPQTAKRVLDVGCGQGLTGGLLRVERGIEVIGLELHPEVAEAAKRHLSGVVVGDIESMDLPFASEYFDCIILADVLEHLVDPWSALQKITKYLSPKGTIVASIPNIRNLAIIGKLMDGSWEYVEHGILDRGHLRFFARKEMFDLFTFAGLQAEIAEIVRDPLFENMDLRQFVEPQDINYGRFVLQKMSTSDLVDLTAIQFVFIAKPIIKKNVVKAAIPRVSVVIPVFNNFAYTKNCLESIFSCKECTPFEVIVVDDASTDNSSENIRQLSYSVRIVRHEQNCGFAISCNDGAKVALGEYVLFLNNDTTVLPGWIDSLINCLQSNTTIGLAGSLQIFPDSGKVQQAGIVCGENKMLYSIYNNQLFADHPAVNKAREFQFVAGSCMLVEKKLFFNVGGFDESYLNSCEDVDLCMKVRRAGRKVYYCPQSRIHHYESKTVNEHSKASANYQLFLHRWSDDIVQDDYHYLSADNEAFCSSGVPNKRDQVVLIAPPRYFKYPMVSGYSGFSKNLGLGYLAATLREASIQVSIIDAFAMGINDFLPIDAPNGSVYRCGLQFGEIASQIPPGTTFIGISIPFTNVASIVFELAAYLKARFPTAKIVVGGVHPSTFPEESLNNQGVDYVISGEGEFSLLALVQGDVPDCIPGLYWRDGAGTVMNASQPARINNLDDLPFPAWDLLPMELYFSVSPRGDRLHRALSLITSRGCPFSCRFCSVHPVSGRNWRARSPENVLAEVRLAFERYNVNHLEIEDDNFTLDKQRALSILRGLKDISPEITWSAHNGVRVDTLDDELLEEISRSGCVQLNLAIEHGSPTVLKAMNKQLSLEKVKLVVKQCGKLGISSNGFCIVGYPGENKETFRESFLYFKELKKLGLTRVIPFVVNAYPGTDVYYEAREEGWLNSGTDDQLFFLEDEFVSIITNDSNPFTVKRRKMAMEALNAPSEIDADSILSMV